MMDILLLKDENLPLKWEWMNREIGPIILVLSGVLLVNSCQYIREGGLIFYLIESVAVFLVIVLFIVIIIHLIRHRKHATA